MAETWGENDKAIDESWGQGDAVATIEPPISEEEQGRRNLQAINRGEIAAPVTVDDRLKLAGKYYESSALKRGAKAVGNAIFGNEARPEYIDAERNMVLSGTGGLTINDIRNNGGILGVPIANALHGIRGILDEGAQGIVNIGNQTARAAREDIEGQRKAAKLSPTILDEYLPQGVNDALAVATGDTPRRAIAATGAGLGIGTYNVVAPLATGAAKTFNAVTGDAMRLADAAGFAGNLREAAAREEAEMDQDRQVYEQKYEHPAQQALTDVGNLPAVTNTAAQIPSFVVPLKLGVEAIPAANAVGRFVEGGINRAAPVIAEGIRQAPARLAQGVGIAGEKVADKAGIVGAGMGAYSFLRGNPIAAVGEAAVGGIAQPLLRSGSARLRGIGDRAIMGPRTAPLYGAEAIAQDARIAGQIAGQGTAAIIPGAIGGTLGGLSSQPGDTEEGVRSGFAFGTLAGAVPSMIGAGFARQAGERAARTQEFQRTGAQLLESDPFYKEQNDSTQFLSPQNQGLVNRVRGLFSGRTDANGNPIRIVVQSLKTFMEGVRAVNGGQLAPGFEAAGYYLGNDGTVYLNSASAKGQLSTTLQHALGHEATHPLISVLDTLDPTQANRLYKAQGKAALDKNGNPTANFQRFIDNYNGGPVDWSSLPETANNGPSKQYYLHELGAQTGAVMDAISNPGKYALKPEASDVVFDALGDFARNRGYGNPNVREGLPGEGETIPADAGLYAATREGFRTLAQAPRGARSASPGQPIVTGGSGPITNAPTPLSGNATRPATIETSNTGTTPARTAVESGQSSVQSPRNNVEYQNALAVLTAPKNLGGGGFSEADVLPKLDAAFADPNTLKTAGDLIFHVRTGRARDARLSTNPQGQPAPSVESVAQVGERTQQPADSPVSETRDNSATISNNSANPASSVAPASAPVVPTVQEQALTQPTQSPVEGQGNQSLVSMASGPDNVAPNGREILAANDALQNQQQVETNTTPPQNTVVSSSSVSPLSQRGQAIADNARPENSVSASPQTNSEVSPQPQGSVLGNRSRSPANESPVGNSAQSSVQPPVVSANPPAGQTQASAQSPVPTSQQSAAGGILAPPEVQNNTPRNQKQSPPETQRASESSVQTTVANESAQGNNRPSLQEQLSTERAARSKDVDDYKNGVKPIATAKKGPYTVVVMPNGRELIIHDSAPNDPAASGNFMGWYEPDHQSLIGVSKERWDGMTREQRAEVEAKLQLEKWVPDEYWSLRARDYHPELYRKWRTENRDKLGTDSNAENEYWKKFFENEQKTPPAQENNRSSSPTTNSSQISSSLTVEDVARVRKEAEDAFTYTGPKPNKATLAKNPNALQERIDAAKAESVRLAVFRAHTTNDPLAVRFKINDNGEEIFTGSRFNESDPVHAEILSKLDDDTRSHLSAIEEAIANKQPVNFDYMSADTKGTGVTGKGRRVAQSLSDAQSRAEGEGPAVEANKLFRPYDIKVYEDGTVVARGFSYDKLISNAEELIRYNNKRGDATIPYRSVNDPQFAQDVQRGYENHNNGYSISGKPLVGTEAIPVTQTPGYEPHIIPQDRADFINAVTQGSGNQLTKTPKGAAIREFAKANGLNVDEASREVNAYRAQIDARGDLQAPGGATGTRGVLENPLFENVRPDLITRIYREGEGVPSSNLRAGSFAGDRRQLTAKGTPNSKFAGASFLPAESAGASTPEQIAEAGRLWKEEGTDSPYFQKWFGFSHLVNEDGTPMRLYHATPAKFDAFKPGGNNPKQSGYAIWMSADPEYQPAAHNTGLRTDKKGNRVVDDGVSVLPLYASIKSPLIIDASTREFVSSQYGKSVPSVLSKEVVERMKEDGYDGVIRYDPKDSSKIFEVAAFDPEQVKSAIANRGTFNANDARISYLPASTGQPITDNSAPGSFSPLRSAILPRASNRSAPLVFTHRRSSATLPSGNVLQFHNGEENTHYGDHVWTLQSKLPAVPDEIVKFASDYYGVTEKEAANLVRPERIVNSAGAWDDTQFVSDLWQAMEGGDIKEYAGFQTPEGAVVLNQDGVKMKYSGPSVKK